MTTITETLPELPIALGFEGWEWEEEGGKIRLINRAEGLRTALHKLDQAHKAIALVEKQFSSTPRSPLTTTRRPAPTVPATPAAPEPEPAADLVTLLAQHAATLGDKPAHYPRPAGLPELVNAPLDLVVAGRWQPRSVFVDVAFNELVESILEYGVQTPIHCFANEYGELELIAGERRLRACRHIRLDTIPVLIKAEYRDNLHIQSVFDNLQRADLTPVEQGIAFERLIAELQISEAQLATKLGKNRAYIQQRRAIASAAPAVQQALTEERITFSQARGICKGAGTDHELQQVVLKEIEDGNKRGWRRNEDDTRKEAERLALDTLGGKLKALGWQVQRAKCGDQWLTLVYAPTARPEPWTTAEMQEITATGQRPPDGQPIPAGELKNGDRSNLVRCGYGIESSSGLGGWIIVTEPDGKQWSAMHVGEMQTMIGDANHQLSSFARDVATTDWKFKWNGTTWWEFKNTKGETITGDGLANARKKLEAIKAGKAKPRPDDQPAVYHCGNCKQEMIGYDSWHYVYPEGHYNAQRWCTSCANARKQQIEAEAQAAASAFLASHRDWLHAAPRPLLESVASQFDTQIGSPMADLTTDHLVQLTARVWSDQLRSWEKKAAQLLPGSRPQEEDEEEWGDDEEGDEDDDK